MSLELIEHKSAPVSGAFDFTGHDLSGYARLYLYLDDLIAGADGARTDLRLGTGGTLHATGYRSTSSALSSSGSTNRTNLASALQVLGQTATTTWGVGNAAGEGGMSAIVIRNPAAGAWKHVIWHNAYQAPSAALVRAHGGGQLEQTGLIDRIATVASTGIASGSATLFGQKATTDTDPAFDLIARQAAPVSGEFNFTGLNLSAYRRVLVRGRKLRTSVSGETLWLRLGIGGTIQTSGYVARHRALSSSGADNVSSPTTFVPILGGTSSLWGPGTQAGASGRFDVELSHLAAGAHKLAIARGVLVAPSGAVIQNMGGAVLTQTGAIDTLRVLAASGSIASGEVSLYGVRIV